MNISAVFHEAKSKYAYAYDNKTLHIKIRTAKDDIENVKFIFGDPFNWGPSKEDPEKWVWLNQYNVISNMKKEYTTEYHDYWSISVTPKWRRCKYVFILEKGNEEILFGSHTVEDLKKKPQKKYDIFNYFNFPFINEIDIFKAPSWVKETVWYQIFPERFANGDESNDLPGTLKWGSVKEKVKNDMFFGGDLKGIIDHLDYIKDLGATGIYFTPLFESKSSHKYDTTDYFNIDKQFGNNETFKTLVREAHNRGIKVMLDAVFNHCGWYHPFWQDVLKNHENSKYKDYFHIHKYPAFTGDPRNFKFQQETNELNFDTFAFTPFMPKWNTENPEVRKYLLEVAEYWIKEYDIDAWRLDVSNEVDHEFWRAFRKTVSSIDPNFYIIGENWDDSNPWLKGDQFHSVMNYHFMFYVWNFFGKEITNAIDFKYEINKLLTTYPKNVMQYMFNLVDSHDTERILSICKESKDKVILAYLFLLTFTGTPSIYYGGEIGLTGGHDPDNRRCMIWDEEAQDLDLYKTIQSLIKVRKQSKALQSGDFVWLDANKNTNHIVYKKETIDESVVIFINNNNQSTNIKVPNELIGNRVLDLFTNEQIVLKNNLSFNKYGYAVFKLL